MTGIGDSQVWPKVEGWARSYFTFPRDWDSSNSRMYARELSKFGVEELVLAFRELGTEEHGAWTVMPPVSAVRRRLTARGAVQVDPVEEAKKVWVGRLRDCARLYGRDMALVFMNPNGEHDDWVPAKLPAHKASEYGHVRKRMLDLGVMEGQK